jgi:hypothetical protein
MNIVGRIIGFILLLVFCSLLQASEPGNNILVLFYKQEPLSLRGLDEVKAILPEFADSIEVYYINIEDKANLDLLDSYYLADVEFPFAVALNGCMSAMIDEHLVDFIGYPEDMEDAGDFEGNWSIEDLKAALHNPDLLWTEIWLPMGDEEEGGGE